MPRRPEGLFSDDDVIRKVDRELVLLAGGPRALLLQVAHPLVAKAVAEHSGFAANPFARLQRTLDAAYGIVFGTAEDAERIAKGVRRVHDRVVGEGYEANDPELLHWVHATLVDTALVVHARFLRPLTRDEAETYYRQSSQVARLLGVTPDVQPPDLASFRQYIRDMVATVEVTDDARAIADTVLRPDVPAVVSPAFLAVRALTAGLLPARLRRAYGLRWDGRMEIALAGLSFGTRAVLPRLPAPLRRVPAFAMA